MIGARIGEGEDGGRGKLGRCGTEEIWKMKGLH